MEKSHSTGYKDFLKVLLLMHEYSLEEVSQAIIVISPLMANDVSLRQYLMSRQKQQPIPVDCLINSTTQLITMADTHQYDQLLQGVN